MEDLTKATLLDGTIRLPESLAFQMAMELLVVLMLQGLELVEELEQVFQMAPGVGEQALRVG
jgi:hypothetical protein